jgi:putative RecB family exonuclease
MSISPKLTPHLYIGWMPFDNSLPAYLSPSKLNDFTICYRKYQYGAIDRLPSKSSYPLVKGRIVHIILDKLFGLEGEARTLEAAKSFINEAKAAELTSEAQADIGFDDALDGVLNTDIDKSLHGYFRLEEPAKVNKRQAEFTMKATIAETPLYGILDRLDEEEDGSLTIVDYKTGKFPRGDYFEKRFENMEIYAALFKETHKVRPTKLRLIYVEAGQSDEKLVSGKEVDQQIGRASAAWRLINRFYTEGEFPARPSRSACRWCPYTQECIDSGVAVAI